MTKEEKIKEAYGELYPKKQNHIREDGSIDSYYLSGDDKKSIDFETTKIGRGYYYVRPKSLKGIENNNGWIKIESEEDLPEQGGEYTVFRMSKKSRATYCKNDRWMIPENDYPKTTFQHGITHYRKKEIIPNPIY